MNSFVRCWISTKQFAKEANWRWNTQCASIPKPFDNLQVPRYFHLCGRYTLINTVRNVKLSHIHRILTNFMGSGLQETVWRRPSATRPSWEHHELPAAERSSAAQLTRLRSAPNRTLPCAARTGLLSSATGPPLPRAPSAPPAHPAGTPKLQAPLWRRWSCKEPPDVTDDGFLMNEKQFPKHRTSLVRKLDCANLTIMAEKVKSRKKLKSWHSQGSQRHINNILSIKRFLLGQDNWWTKFKQ